MVKAKIEMVKGFKIWLKFMRILLIFAEIYEKFHDFQFSLKIMRNF